MADEIAKVSPAIDQFRQRLQSNASMGTTSETDALAIRQSIMEQILTTEAETIDELFDEINSGASKFSDFVGKPLSFRNYTVRRSDLSGSLTGVFLAIEVQDLMTGDERVLVDGSETLTAVMDTADRRGWFPFDAVLVEVTTAGGNTVHRIRKVNDDERKYIAKARRTIDAK